MELILTSFGLNQGSPGPSAANSLFYRMPPTRTLSSDNDFAMDYSALLLCERVVVDEKTFDLLENMLDSPYKSIAEAIKALYDEVFIDLVNFDGIIRDNDSLIREMTDSDLRDIHYWDEPLQKSFDIWSRLSNHLYQRIRNNRFDETFYRRAPHALDIRDIQPPIIHFASHATFDDPDKGLLSSLLDIQRDNQLDMNIWDRYHHSGYEELVLKMYLSYVNANIVLSKKLGIGFYDWADYGPFYKSKFLSVGIERLETDDYLEAVHSLFEISFPELAVNDTNTLIKILQDKQIGELRLLVQEAVNGRVTFDEEFARRVLLEVLRIERKAAKYRNITSYVTMPIGFMPGVGPIISAGLQKATEEAIGKVIEKSLDKNYQWFYMLSDYTDS